MLSTWFSHFFYGFPHLGVRIEAGEASMIDALKLLIFYIFTLQSRYSTVRRFD